MVLRTSVYQLPSESPFVCFNYRILPYVKVINPLEKGLSFLLHLHVATVYVKLEGAALMQMRMLIYLNVFTQNILIIEL